MALHNQPDKEAAIFLVFPAKEAVAQLASTNMVTIWVLSFLAIPAQAGTHASTST
jgi:hypothetical protein